MGQVEIIDPLAINLHVDRASDDAPIGSGEAGRIDPHGGENLLPDGRDFGRIGMIKNAPAPIIIIIYMLGCWEGWCRGYIRGTIRGYIRG